MATAYPLEEGCAINRQASEIHRLASSSVQAPHLMQCQAQTSFHLHVEGEQDKDVLPDHYGAEVCQM